MIDIVDMEHARYQLARAEARLNDQKAFIEKLPIDTDPRSQTKESQRLLELQGHLAAALAYHAHLLDELSFRLSIYKDVAK